MIPFSTPWLVARASIKSPFQPDSVKFSDSAPVAYTGSSEFEGGALFRSLSRMMTHRDTLVVNQLPSIIEDDEPLYALHYREPVDLFENYLPHLEQMRESEHTLGLKEWINFSKGMRDATSLPNDSTGAEVIRKSRQKFARQTDLWWDIENDVIWSFDSHYMLDRLPKHLASSFAYMVDKEKEKYNNI